MGPAWSQLRSSLCGQLCTSVPQDVQPADRAEVFIHFHGKYTSLLRIIRFTTFQRDGASPVSTFLPGSLLALTSWRAVAASSSAEEPSTRSAFHSVFSRLTSLALVCFRKRRLTQ